MKKAFKVFLLKPSHYDDEGYVIQWRVSLVPSNSLACLYGLVQSAANRSVLGPDVDIDIIPIDETNAVVDCATIAKLIKAAGGGLVGLVGVQSNQFPRALDIARELRRYDVQVVIGGFHVSGCLAMLPGLPLGLQDALDIGVSLFAGESEGLIDALLQDSYLGKLQLIYNHLGDTPNLSGADIPILPSERIHRTITDFTSLDAGRGCPFQCSFCTIINVQGRKSRYRTADDIEQIIRANAAQGIYNFFVTDDNFARNKNWEAILDRIIELRERENFNPSLIFQVDTLCHRIPRFIEKAARAGCISVFIGLENINPESLFGTKKRQNKIWEYREMLLEWRRHGVLTAAGYILGFPSDTPESVARDIAIIQKELPIDVLEFFVLTPLPGSEDHKKLYLAGADLETDLNRYDLEHVCGDHPKMGRGTWQRVYRDAWLQYYSDEHVETIMRRGIASGIRSRRKLFDDILLFSGATRIENVHPLQFGVLRRKVRNQRRFGQKVERPIPFYAKRCIEIVQTLGRWLALYGRYRRIYRRVLADAKQSELYTDAALTPPSAGMSDNLVAEFANLIPATHGAPRALGNS
jgi:radical SAM superfamily enzyme YgiQ (UPF0313 family)